MSFNTPHKKDVIKRARLTQQVQDTIRISNFSDPVGAQYLYDDREEIIYPHENTDPIGDYEHGVVKGLVHRYPDRVLLKITDICAVYCRFCFRKDMVGKGAGILNSHELDTALSYISKNKNIREVILSGGDPLTLSNRRLKEAMDKLNKIEHVDFIRFHTRTPIVKPSRIDDDLIDILNTSKKAIYIVLHINHVQEMNDKIIEMLDRLSQSRATLLSQTVLLKTINDNCTALTNLFTTLVKNRVKPYYLHHPDLATGTNHFRVSIKKGQALMKELRGNISGLCLPTYVLDVPGGFGKIPLNHTYAEELNIGHYAIEDIHGAKHNYLEHLQKGKDISD